MRPFRDDFDLDVDLLYLNSGSHSICPRAVIEAVTKNLREYERNPTEGIVRAPGRLWRVQQRLADFLRACPQDLILAPNVTAALNHFVLNVPLAQGGEVLVSDLEYGAVANLCRYRAERDALDLRWFHLPATPAEYAGLTPERLATQVIGALGPDTRLLVLSHVATGTGLVLPIERIARETRERGVLLVVDGAHAAGALDLDFSKLEDVDFYGSNLHKWLMGPKGTGFGWVPKRHHAQLPPLTAGWTTYGAEDIYGAFGGGDRFAERMLMGGCHDFSPFFALEAALDYWGEKGSHAIRARLDEVGSAADRAMAGLPGWPLVSPPRGPMRGPLSTYALPPPLEAEGYALMARVLFEHRLQISMTRVQGRWHLRLSPHVYNEEAELVRAAEILKSLT